MIDNLHELSVPELEALVEEAKRQLDVARERDLQKVYQDCKRLAATIGLSLDELIARAREPKVRKSNRPVAPRYKCPDTGETWTGQGRTPTWLVSKLAGGASKEDFRIPGI